MDGLPEFFFADGAHTQQGPISASQLRDLYRARLVGDRTYVFASDGAMDGWQLIPQVAPLYAFCTELPPAPAAPPAAKDDAIPQSPARTGGGSTVTFADAGAMSSPRTPRLTAMARKLPARTPDDRLRWREAADERRDTVLAPPSPVRIRHPAVPHLHI